MKLTTLAKALPLKEANVVLMPACVAMAIPEAKDMMIATTYKSADAILPMPPLREKANARPSRREMH